MPQVPSFVVDMSMQVWLNLLSSHWEHRYCYTAPAHERDDAYLAGVFKDAIRDGTVKQFTRTDYGADYLLSAFEHMTKGQPIEYGMIVLSDKKDRNVFRFVAVSRGTSSEVRLPTKHIERWLRKRAAQGIRSRVLIVHNHPQHALKKFLEQYLGMPLGPSGADRRALVAWTKLSHVQPEFFLYEADEWRRFTTPDLDWCFDMFERICASLEGKAAPSRARRTRQSSPRQHSLLHTR